MTATVPTTQLPIELPIEFVRQQFPSLQGDWVFMDNAGGSQVVQPVLDRLQDYLLTTNVQLGASYAVSQAATARLDLAQQGAAALINAADPSEVVMGASTSLLLRILAHCYGQTLQPGDEVIVTDCDHEANITPWKELRQRGIVVKTWQTNLDSLQLELADLEPLITPRTRLVTLVHASNVLGTIHPIRAIADFVHERGALVCVDGVGYAPHRQVDVQALDVDFYVFSFYKVYGPHHALLYGRRERLLALPSFNHDFIGPDVLPYKLQPGGASYELSYSTLGVTDYLQQLGARCGGEGEQPSQLAWAFAAISRYEEVICDRILSFLRSRSRVRIIGEPTAAGHRRVPTIAFVVAEQDSASLPPRIDPHRIGLRYGDFYAKHLIERLGLTRQNGVVRISLVHYNTLEECNRLIQVLEPML